MVKHLLEDFGIEFTNEIPNGASYLFPDGEFISLGKNYNKGMFEKNVFHTGIHPDLDHFMYKCDLCRSGQKNAIMFSDNAVKLQDGTIVKCERIYICLPQEELTEIQYQRLEDWLYQLEPRRSSMDLCTCFNNFYKVIDFYNEETQTGYTVSDIMKEVKKVYASSNK